MYVKHIGVSMRTTKRMIHFGIVLPVFNTEKYLEECLNSLLGQQYQYFTIYAVDDSSTDGSLAILKKIEKQDKRIRVVKLSKNQGVSAARNVALDLIVNEEKCTHVVFVDADDVVDELFLQLFFECLNLDPKLDYVVCGVDFLGKNGILGRNYSKYAGFMNSVDIVEQVLLTGIWKKRCCQNWGLTNKVFSLELIKNKRFVKSMKLGEDFEFWCRVINSVTLGYFISDALYHYRIRKSSATHTLLGNYGVEAEALLKLVNEYSCSLQLYRNLTEVAYVENIFSMYLRLRLRGKPADIAEFKNNYVIYAKELAKKHRFKISRKSKYWLCLYAPDCVLLLVFNLWQRLKGHTKENCYS